MPLSPVAMLELRASLRAGLREFFAARSYLEVETPALVLCPGTEVHLGYFSSEWHDIAGRPHRLWLRSSPELHMKQLLALGATRIFQIGPCFRNGGELADWHHPEFSMLEWYGAGLNLADLITETEDLLRFTLEALTPAIRRAGAEPLQLPKVIERIAIADAFRDFLGLELQDLDPDLGAKAKDRGVISAQPTDDFETAFFKILLECIEPELARRGAAVLYDYPASQAALATIAAGADGSPAVAKRAEFYLGGVELSNGFEELLGAAANQARLQQARTARQALGLPVPDDDPDFIGALAQGLPKVSGNALGFDRWLALMVGAKGLAAVLPFKQARPFGRGVFRT